MTRQLIMFRSRLTDALEGRKEAGVTAIEYSIMAALIVAVLVVAYFALANQIGALFGQIQGHLNLPNG